MKRSITVVLIIAILINTIFPNFIYASEYGTFDEAQEHQKDGATINDKLWEEGKADVKSDKSSRTEDVNDTKSSSNGESFMNRFRRRLILTYTQEWHI